MRNLHAVSIMLEVVIMVLGIILATLKRKFYGWLIALAFLFYVFYDMVYFLNLKVSPSILHVVFFIATISILITVVWLFKKR